MAVWSKINFKDIEYSRIDSEFYQPKYVDELKLWNSLSKIHTVTKLKNILSKPVRTGHTPKNRLIKREDDLIPFIKTNTLREGKIVYSKVEFLPKRCLSSNDYIEDNASIVTIIGATKEIVGRVAIKEFKDPPSTTNQNVAIINFKPEIDPYYAMIYLQSKFGRDQLWRHSRQTEQVNLNCREVERVLFPIISKELQLEIGNLVRNSFKLDEASLNMFKQACDLLEQELGLDTISFEKPNNYIATFSEAIDFMRIDSEYFQPKFRKINELIITYKNGYERLLTNIIYVKADFNISTNKGNKIEYIELSKINPVMGFIDDVDEIEKKDAPSRAKRIVAIGDVIASSVVGSVDKAGLVSEKENGFIASNGFFQFRSNYYSPEFLLIMIKSTIIKEQFQQQSTGGILSAVPEQNLKHIIIPKIDIEIQKKITELVKDAHQKARASKDLLAQAKNRVEQLIEEAI